ncbi:hypothetical protein BJX65DRAFT_174013 [Aspergillus insuetus]
MESRAPRPESRNIEHNSQVWLRRGRVGFGGLTPLHEGVIENSISTITSWSTLVTAHRNEANFLGQTPLHLAGSNVGIARVLIQPGHDVDAVDLYGRTPLMYAAALGCTDTV